ncbi:tRNA (adenosine(37)-N6)-dimethylallyltransferase MiaA [soil metagenome]
MIEAALGAGKLVVFVGPTASCKSALAMALAEKHGGEIISVDSVQIYRAFDVGSGKPSAEELARVRHHLVSTHDPKDAVDAARFADLAEAAIAEVRARGKVPILCGGTYLWMRAILLGLAAAPPADEAIRVRHRAIAERDGRSVLHDMLAAVDPKSATALHPNDVVRVSRALEVHELTGTKMSDLHEAHGFRTPKHEHVLVGVAFTLPDLRARIDRRVRAFLANGWVAEVKQLIADGHGDARAMGSVGYREVLAHVRGEIAEADLEQRIIHSTWIFARRQRTWLRDEPVTWLS